jgi:hypothetical protein
MDTPESTPTIAGVYRDRAAELEEKAEKLADSSAAQRAEELFADGWRVWTSDGYDSRIHPHVIRRSPEWPKGKRRDPREFLDQKGSEVVKCLRILTYYSEQGRSEQGRRAPLRPTL